ncbi:MAG TPA: hypothetical protein VI197_23585, partial [Polyangiaceae bacterium]
MKRESALVGFGLVALGALGGALALARCTDGEPRSAQGPAASERTAPAPAQTNPGEPNQVAPARARESVVDPTQDDAEPASDTVATAPALTETSPAASGGNTVSRARAAAQPADLQLLGRIERELQ